MPADAKTLGRLEPIRGLSGARLEELATLCQLDVCAMGSDPLQTLGVAGNFIYLIRGELKVVLHDGSMRVLVGACDVANWPIGYKTVLPLSSKAITEVEMLRLDYDLLDIMMTWDELSSVAERTPPKQPPESAAWSTMTGAFSIQALTSSALAQLSPAHIHELLQRFQRTRVKRGQAVIREGHREGWDLSQDYDLNVMKPILSQTHGISEKARKSLTNAFMSRITMERIQEGRPFKLSYILNAACSLDWNVLDLFIVLPDLITSSGCSMSPRRARTKGQSATSHSLPSISLSIYSSTLRSLPAGRLSMTTASISFSKDSIRASSITSIRAAKAKKKMLTIRSLAAEFHF